MSWRSSSHTHAGNREYLDRLEKRARKLGLPYHWADPNCQVLRVGADKPGAPHYSFSCAMHPEVEGIELMAMDHGLRRPDQSYAYLDSQYCSFQYANYLLGRLSDGQYYPWPNVPSETSPIMWVDPR